MSCTQTLSGIARDCANSLGGIVEVYIANYDDVTAVTKTTGKVTAITMASSAKFKKYQFRPGICSMTSTGQVNKENGTNYVQTLLDLVFNRMETTKRVEVMALVQADAAVIVKDANGLYWYLGETEPVTINAYDGATGAARADRNGYHLVLEDNNPELPAEILTGTGGVDIDSIVA